MTTRPRPRARPGEEIDGRGGLVRRVSRLRDGITPTGFVPKGPEPDLTRPRGRG